MQSISFTPSQFNSSRFLSETMADANAYLGQLNACSVNVVDATLHQGPVLVLAAEGLCFEKIHQVQQALASQLTVDGFRYSPMSQHCSTQAVIMDVSLLVDAAVIDVAALSKQFYVELALLEQRPTLSAPGLLVMDMDSTMIGCECIDEIAYLANVGEQVSEVTELAMQGKLDFAQSLHQRVACLTGIEVALLQSIRDKLPLMPGLSLLVKTLQQAGWKIAIASGGFTYFANYLRDRLELDAAVSNTLSMQNGLLSGTVEGQVVDAKVKAQILQSLAEQWGIAHEQTIAMGDGANDLAMMKVAGLGVAFHAKPIVDKQAVAAIRIAGLDTLLHYLQPAE
ncbi:phosphoserine phosphatase SerB [Alteromonadaceae bacterium BrNp21-10]|nr:phosphoserine phosphatase SerB [Alteromonadaceae bacterium BrNp21-10]